MEDVEMADENPVENLEDYPMAESDIADIIDKLQNLKLHLSNPDSRISDALNILKSISKKDETVFVQFNDQHFTSMDNKLKSDLDEDMLKINSKLKHLGRAAILEKLAELLKKHEDSASFLKENVLLFKQYLVNWVWDVDIVNFDEIVSFLLKNDLGDNLLDMLIDIDKMRLFHFEPMIRALVYVSIYGNNDLKRKAYGLVGKICYNVPRLFCFVECGQDMWRKVCTKNKKNYKSRCLGWNSMRRKAIAQFYTDSNKSPLQLLLQCVKYRQRYKWTHRQILGRCHPKCRDKRSEARNLVLCYLSRNFTKVKEKYDKMMCNSNKPVHEETKNIYELIRQIDGVKKMTVSEFQGLVESIKNGIKVGDSLKPTFLSREHLNTEVLSKKEIWQALLQHMKPFAMIRNLGLMTSKGMFNEENSEETKIVLDTLKDKSKLKDIPSVKLLTAMKYYEMGQGAPIEKRAEKAENENQSKIKLQWTPNKAIKRALCEAFRLTFQECKNTSVLNQKLMIIVDRRETMFEESKESSKETMFKKSKESSKETMFKKSEESSMRPIDFASALAYFLWEITTKSEVFCFPKSGGTMEKIMLRKDMQFSSLVNKFIQNQHNIKLEDPINYAIEKNLTFDGFVFLTDKVDFDIRKNVRTTLNNYDTNFSSAYSTKRKIILCGVMDGGIKEILAEGDIPHKLASFGTHMFKEVLEVVSQYDDSK